MNIFDIAARKIDWNIARHKTIAENIANANTPGYKARDLVPFSKILSSVETVRQPDLDALRPGGSSSATANSVKTSREPPHVLSGNNVNTEEQMKELASVHRSQLLELGVLKSFHRMTILSAKGGM